MARKQDSNQDNVVAAGETDADGAGVQVDLDSGPLAVNEDVLAQGYIGTSPERERTGLDDKGLSQRTPSVMDPSLPPVDARPGIDDSEAIAAAQKSQK